MSGLVLWDVDTQVDFMLPDGKPAAKAGRRHRPSERLELVE